MLDSEFESITMVLLAQLRRSPTDHDHRLHDDVVTRLQATTPKSTCITHLYCVQESIVSVGYQVAPRSILVEANPTIGDSLPGAAERQTYAVLDGHHRVAALRALQVNGTLPSDYALLVSILK